MIQKIRSNVTNTQAIIGIAASVGVRIFLTVVMETSMQKAWQKEQLAAVLSAIPQEWAPSQKKITAQVQAKAAIIYDLTSGEVLYNKNADMQLPLASLTKIVTALVADTELGATTIVRVSEQALMTEGESGLIAGDSWRVRDLSDFMLAVSSNDAASVLATQAGSQAQFIARMNTLSRELGLESTIFFNESGLDRTESLAGAYGSARDIAQLFAYAIFAKPKLLEATTFTEFTSVSSTGLRYKAVNTNKIIHKIPGLIGGKTGFTDLAGGNLAIVFDAGIGRPIAVVVLGSTIDGRFDDVLRLVESVI